MLWLNEYQRYARLAPGLLIVLPIALTITIFGIPEQAALSSVLTLLSLAGGPLLLAEIVSHRGRKSQVKIWKSWNGPPTTRFLRLREETDNKTRRLKWRESIQSVTDVAFLNARRERARPEEADERIDVAVSMIRDLTRDTQKFPVVWTENKSYGYHRNVYGVRWFGRVAAIVTLIVVLAVMLITYRKAGSVQLTWQNVAALMVNTGFVLLWFYLPSKDRMKVVAERYAFQLLQAANILASERRGGQNSIEPR
jgi:hypothetical protein